MTFESLTLLEPPGPVQACTGTVLPCYLLRIFLNFYIHTGRVCL